MTAPAEPLLSNPPPDPTQLPPDPVAPPPPEPPADPNNPLTGGGGSKVPGEAALSSDPATNITNDLSTVTNPAGPSAPTAAMQKAQNAAPFQFGASGTSDPNAPLAQRLLDYAMSLRGVPYKWGGSDPTSGLDCSGLVQTVFKQFGINLPRVAGDQAHAGHQVSLSTARPGDLLYIAEANHGEHIGIYLGNGMFLNAPHTGDVVRVAQFNPQSITRVERVLPDSAWSGMAQAGPHYDYTVGGQ